MSRDTSPERRKKGVVDDQLLKWFDASEYEKEIVEKISDSIVEFAGDGTKTCRKLGIKESPLSDECTNEFFKNFLTPNRRAKTPLLTLMFERLYWHSNMSNPSADLKLRLIKTLQSSCSFCGNDSFFQWEKPKKDGIYRSTCVDCYWGKIFNCMMEWYDFCQTFKKELDWLKSIWRSCAGIDGDEYNFKVRGYYLTVRFFIRKLRRLYYTKND